MNCESTQRLIDGYFDGELDLVNSLEMEQHLQTCAACAEELQNRQVLRNAIRASSLTYDAPSRLHRRLRW